MTNKAKDYSYIFMLLSDKMGEKKQFCENKQKKFYDESRDAAIDIHACASIYLAAKNIKKIKVRIEDFFDEEKINNLKQNVSTIKNDVKVDFVLRDHNATEVLLYNQQLPVNLRTKSTNDKLKDEKSLKKIMLAFEEENKNGYNYNAMEMAENIANAILKDQYLVQQDNIIIKKLDTILKNRINSSLQKLDFVARCDKEFRPIYENIENQKKIEQKNIQKAKQEHREKIRQKAEARKATENKRQETIEKFSRYLTMFDIKKHRYNQMFYLASEHTDLLTREEKRSLAGIEDNLNKIYNRIRKLDVTPYSYVARGKDGTLLVDKNGFYCIDSNASTKALSKFVKAMEENTVCECYDRVNELEDCLKEFMPTGEQIMTRIC